MYSSGHMDTQHPRCVCTSTHPSQASAHTSSEESLLCRVVLSLLPSTPTIFQDKIWQLRQPRRWVECLAWPSLLQALDSSPEALGQGAGSGGERRGPEHAGGGPAGGGGAGAPTLGGLPIPPQSRTQVRASDLQTPSGTPKFLEPQRLQLGLGSSDKGRVRP